MLAHLALSLAAFAPASHRLDAVAPAPHVQSQPAIEVVARIMQLPGQRTDAHRDTPGPGLTVTGAGNGGRPIEAELNAVTGGSSNQPSTSFKGTAYMFLVSLSGSFSVGDATFDLASGDRGDFRMISAPHVALASGQAASIEVAAPVQWMRPDADGRFSVQSDDAITEGVTLHVTASTHKNGIELQNLDIEFREVAWREPVEQVNLDIGYPAMRKTRVNTALTIPDGYGLLVPLQPVTANAGQIYVLLTARASS